ncbi:cytochrome c oxidase assembly factor 4 homolog, mitochondrial-like [Lytechinus variegatus]|uniref:cytochrome c oxidase assembly factor 4 homolog, mitochondrial-like n=1 Tax=Lytechinus variegatus TaxID=7654 RepID=UPI001BB1D4E1|nr:cytochrome c oxidase assembly factor 4 homolog, mitochondrial-like [Lytechinus variegatus]
MLISLALVSATAGRVCRDAGTITERLIVLKMADETSSTPDQAVPSPQPHVRSRPDPDDEEDPVEKMISQTGCLELHYAVQECMADNRDWRKCQDHVSAFKKCITDSAERQMKAVRDKTSDIKESS